MPGETSYCRLMLLKRHSTCPNVVPTPMSTFLTRWHHLPASGTAWMLRRYFAGNPTYVKTPEYSTLLVLVFSTTSTNTQRLPQAWYYLYRLNHRGPRTAIMKFPPSTLRIVHGFRLFVRYSEASIRLKKKTISTEGSTIISNKWEKQRFKLLAHRSLPYACAYWINACRGRDIRLFTWSILHTLMNVQLCGPIV